jgi:hypothetical protein
MAGAVAAAAIAAWVQVVPAWAQGGPAPAPAPSKVEISYQEPPASKPDLRPIYEGLKELQVLERMQQFLAPLKLKRNLQVVTADCQGNFYKPYRPGGPVTVCYQYVELIEIMADGRRWGAVGPALVTRRMFTVGPFVQEVLHDVALAVFDIQEVPVWGNAEFAADNVAAFIMLQFGPDVASTTILGSAYFLNQLERAVRYSPAYLADVRPTVRQRYYNLLCVAFGSDPVKFANFVPVNRPEQITDLSVDRSERCLREYPELRHAFSEAILKPYVDPQLLKQVLAAKWLPE